VNIGRVIRGEEVQDQRITDYNIMKEMGWSREELDRTPENDVMATMFIMNKINFQAKKEREKMEKHGRSYDRQGHTAYRAENRVETEYS